MRHGLSSYFNQIRNYNLSALIMITGRNNSGELIQRVISPARWVCCRGSMLPTRAKHVCLSPRHNVIFNCFFQWNSVTVLICFNRISQRNCSSNRTERDYSGSQNILACKWHKLAIPYLIANSWAEISPIFAITQPREPLQQANRQTALAAPQAKRTRVKTCPKNMLHYTVA